MTKTLVVENSERRKSREPEIKVWDRWVRFGHWLLAVTFIILYLRYEKFPLHTYAGYLAMVLVTIRIVWGFIGSRAARFKTFLFGPRAVMDYALQALKGHAAYHYSHNPMGAAMVFFLLASIFINGILGLILYSSSQQLGPFGAFFPDAWEENLTLIHEWMGHFIALAVLAHLLGVFWAAWLHRENYVMAMLTGFRRVPRAQSAHLSEAEKKTRLADSIRTNRVYIWLNFKYPVAGSIIIAISMLTIFLLVMEYLVIQNKHWLAY